ncbi:hypothetical protein [Geodermatophilus sp. URMC 63]
MVGPGVTPVPLGPPFVLGDVSEATAGGLLVDLGCALVAARGPLVSGYRPPQGLLGAVPRLLRVLLGDADVTGPRPAVRGQPRQPLGDLLRPATRRLGTRRSLRTGVAWIHTRHPSFGTIR